MWKLNSFLYVKHDGAYRINKNWIIVAICNEFSYSTQIDFSIVLLELLFFQLP